jgi:hypothetical protein
MGFLTNIVDRFFKKMQNDLSNEYSRIVEEKWEIDHPISPLSDEDVLDITKKENEVQIDKIGKTRNIQKYNVEIQKQKKKYFDKLENIKKNIYKH